MLRQRKTTKWKLGAVLLAAGMLAAACSSSSKTNSSASSTTAANSGSSSAGASPSSGQTATGTPIKIGFLGGFTGPLASSVYAARPAVEAWASYVNAHGGINGHPVQLIIKDDQTNPSVSVADAHALVGDHVVAIFDISNFDSNWGTYVAQNKVPIIPTNSTTVGALTNADFFTPGETIDALPASVAQAAQKVGAKKMAVLYCAESPDCTQLTAPIKKAASGLGIQVAFTSSISTTAPNYTAPCLAAEQSGAKAVFVGDAVTVLLAVAKDCNRQGFKPVFIGDDGAVAPTFASATGWSDGMIAAEPNIPFNVNNTPATQTMYAAFKQYQPGFTTNVNFNELAVEGWAAGKLFEAAAKAGQLGVSGPPTSAELLNGLYSPSIQGTTLDGLAPALHFTQGKPTANDCWFWQRTSSGKFTEPYGLTPVCSSPTS
ncbi:MAG: ABC transporter substrate-binding protein [Acidimicrobiaceae bacterium]|nr:ABC transporter substrate-binding protein [Acidimicrobiaceae bacterium]